MPRGRFPLNEIVKILMLITALVAIIVSRQACGQAVTNLFNTVAPAVPDAQIRR
jgi:hypothetical protein